MVAEVDYEPSEPIVSQTSYDSISHMSTKTSHFH